jgi:hypothetical protein
MDMWTLYWLTRIEDLGAAFGFIAFVIGFLLMVWVVYWGVEENFDKEHKPRTSAFVALGVFWILAVLTPSNKDLAIIMGGYYATNNEEFVEMPTKAAKVVNKFMDEYLEESTDKE